MSRTMSGAQGQMNHPDLMGFKTPAGLAPLFKLNRDDGRGVQGAGGRRMAAAGARRGEGQRHPGGRLSGQPKAVGRPHVRPPRIHFYSDKRDKRDKRGFLRVSAQWTR
jgi:hypothetical protein